MRFIYCPLCASKLIENPIGDEGLTPFCEACGKAFFDNPAPCVIVSVLNDRNQICLLKSNYISKTGWTLVAGYVKPGTTLEENAAREVLEETGQQAGRMQYVSSYSFQSRNLIMAGFITHVEAKPFVQSNEIDDIMWCDIGQANQYLLRENNLSGLHFDKTMTLLSLR